MYFNETSVDVVIARHGSIQNDAIMPNYTRSIKEEANDEEGKFRNKRNIKDLNYVSTEETNKISIFR
jgi:hypothetical protein